MPRKKGKVRLPQLTIRLAKENDIPGLLGLYHEAYAGNYPIPIGSQETAMRMAILDQKHGGLLVAEIQGESEPAGVLYFEFNPKEAIAYAGGLVIREKYQGAHLGFSIVESALEWLATSSYSPRSIYGLTRTKSQAPQKICFKNGFLPFGLLPGFANLEGQESMVLVIKHRHDVLEAPRQTLHIIKEVQPILELACQQMEKPPTYHLVLDRTLSHIANAPFVAHDWRWEHDPKAIGRLFQTLSKSSLPNAPMQRPNTLLIHKSGAHFFAHINQAAKHGTLLGIFPCNEEALSLMKSATTLLEQGLLYLDCWIFCEDHLTIKALVQADFLPLGFYPALLERKGRLLDYLILSKLSSPTDLSGVYLEKSVLPYAEYYLTLWAAHWKKDQMAKLHSFSAA